MDERIAALLRGEEAYLVGGVVRDRILGRPVVDVDVACRDPEAAARAYRKETGGALVPLSGPHGVWRVAFRGGRTVDFPLLARSIEDDLAARDFTLNAIASRLDGGDVIDPAGGLADLEAGVVRAVSEGIFESDPLRLLRAARLEDELNFRLDEKTEELVRANRAFVSRPAGERILGELRRLSPRGFRRLDELGLLEPLGGSLERLDRIVLVDGPDYLLVAVFGSALERLPISNETRRFARTLLAAERPAKATPREIHRFRRTTEPWALEALAFVGADDLSDAVRAARKNEPGEPLLRGDELGLPPGPHVGRLLERIAEERAAGTISTREDALALVRREAAATRG